MNAPQALCYPIKSLLVPRPNSGGPVSEWMEFTLQPENTLELKTCTPSIMCVYGVSNRLLMSLYPES